MWCTNDVRSSVQPMSHFSSRPHPVGLCRTLLNVFSIGAPGTLFLWTLNVSFHWSRTIEKFRIREFSVREEEKKKKENKLKLQLKLSIVSPLNFLQSNFICTSLVSKPFPLPVSAPWVCSELASHISCNQLWWIQLMACPATASLCADFVFSGLHVRDYSSIWLVKWFNEWSIVQWMHTCTSAWLSQLSGTATAADSWRNGNISLLNQNTSSKICLK